MVAMSEQSLPTTDPATPIYVWRLDGSDLKLEGFNDAAERTTAGGVRTLVGRRAADLYADEPEILRLFQRCLDGHTTVRHHLHNYRYRSLERTADVDTTLIWVPPDRIAVAAVEGGALDDRLGRIETLESVAQLTAGMAHDFNNLLSVILVDAELTREAIAAGRPAPLALLDDIEQAARSGGALIKKFAAVARHSALSLEPTDLRDAVTDASVLVRRAIPESVELRLLLDQPVGLALVDRMAIQQILLNLVFNARDAMPQGGVLTIALSEADQHACLTVSDDGIGMDPSVRERIFDPFFTTKPPGKGTGLGLAMVQGLMKQHRGQVQVRSEPGAGTAVRLAFPLAHDAAPPHHAPAQRAPPAGTETVLVVEDEPPLRDAARRALSHLGYTVVTAADGVEALAHIERGVVDLVLSDLMLPRKSGADLLRDLRAAGRNVPFLLMTGYGSEDVPGWSELGADAVLLQKPWTVHELARAVRQAIDRTGQRDGGMTG